MPPMVDPSAFIASGALVMGDVQIGADSSVWYYTVIRGDTERICIGEGTNLQDFTMLHADPGIPCRVGHRVTVGHRVILHGCIVENECLIGMGAILLNKVKIGTGSVVGAGALLLEGMEVPPGSLVVGSPARIVRQVDEKSPGADRSDLAALRRAGQAPSSRGVSHPTPLHRDRLIRLHEPAGRSSGKRIHRSST